MADSNTYYTVQKGDTLSSIAKKHNTTVDNLAKLNNISNVNHIVVGQKLIISGSGTAQKETDNGKTVNVTSFGLLANTTRSMFAKWAWSKSDTENYQVIWKYYNKSAGWLIGSNSSVDVKESTYSAPEEATAVSVKIKPIAKTNTANGTSTVKWTADWTTEKNQTYYFENNLPDTPPVPTVTIEKYKLTAEISNININATSIEFEVVKDDKVVFTKATSDISTGHVAFSCNVDAGSNYKVRCRGVRGIVEGEWSGYSSNVSAAVTSPIITTIDVISDKKIKVTWFKVNNAKQYNLQWATEVDKFNSTSGPEYNGSVDKTQWIETDTTISCFIEQFTLGKEHYIRINALGEKADEPSDWSEIKSFIVGKTPIQPTTWSSSTSASFGEPLKLYWLHNSEDASNQSGVKIKLTVNNVELDEIEVTSFPTTYSDSIISSIYKRDPDKDDDKTYVCDINTSHSSLSDGSSIEWQVCTSGVLKDEDNKIIYGEYSVERKVDVYAPPTLMVKMEDYYGNTFNELTSFPFNVICTSGNTANQEPVTYHISIIANDGYETLDDAGNTVLISAGTKVFSDNFDTSDKIFTKEFSANNITLENNINYTVTCSVFMSSGLSAENSVSFTVSWNYDSYVPFAEIGINKDTLSAYIYPYVSQGDTDVLLSVYRREFDGSFTEILSNIDNNKNEFIVDPHPALDYARYRIVSKSKTTGAINYNDLPGYPVGEKSVVIQWAESWSSFDATEEQTEQPPWTGSMLKIPYNINVSENREPDVSHIGYIGRKRPVSYYGTQLGETSTWSMEIPKEDVETLYTIRRLSIWMGDVYVREPSGSGYWASIKVSFSRNNRELTIPITFAITRVEGGI